MLPVLYKRRSILLEGGEGSSCSWIVELVGWLKWAMAQRGVNVHGRGQTPCTWVVIDHDTFE